MALLTYDWKPADPSGAINAYLRGVAIAEQADESQRRVMAQALESAQRAEYQRENQKRLAEADATRLTLQREEAVRRDARERERIGVSRIRATSAGRGGEPWTPLPLPGDSPALPPATPQTGADAALSGPATGDFLNMAANTVENANRPPLSLAVQNPFAGKVDPGDVMIENGAMPSPIISELAGNPTMPAASDLADVPTGFDAAALTLGGGAKFGGSQFPGPAAAPRADGLPTAANNIGGEVDLTDSRDIPVPKSGADIVLTPAETRAVNLLGERDPKGASQLYKQIVSQKAKGSTYKGDAVTWVDETTAVTKGGRLLRRNAEGELEPLTTKRVSSAYRGSDGQSYTQFSDGSWQGDKEPPVGVTIAKIGTSLPQLPMDEQIQRDGYSRVAKPGYENVVTNEEGSALLVAAQGANGRVTYKPFKSSGTIQSLKDGRVIRILPNGETQDIANASSVPAKDATDFTASLKRLADAEDAVTRLELLKEKKGEWAMSNMSGAKGKDIEAAQKELDGAKREVGVYQQRYPALAASMKAKGETPPTPTVFKDESAARAAGHKNGDVIMVVNPATGQPARARLQ